MNLLEMEWLFRKSNQQCFNGMLECAWMRERLLLGRDDSETEAAKAALLQCLALGEENKEKFEEGTFEDVDSLIKRVKYSLGKLDFSTSEGDASDPIPLLMVAEEDDEYFDKADTHYLLGSAHLNRHRISGSVQALKLGINYLKSSFTISRAKDDTGTVFSRPNKVGKFLFNSSEFGHSLEMFKEAAAFAKTVGSQNWEMEFWLNCGRVLLAEEKYEEAGEYLTASLEVAMQMTDEQNEKHIEIAYKLLYGTQLLLGGSLTKDEFYKDTITTSQFIVSEVNAGERRALAMFSIGSGKFLQGQEAEGCHYLQDTLDFVITL
jgi:tetratricopeptide (TPR) repeat protein